MKRRNAILTLGSIGAASAIPNTLQANVSVKQKATFTFCLNTSTISGQKPGILNILILPQKRDMMV
jgi:hypothetical protein